jgi:hypothetical protein
MKEKGRLSYNAEEGIFKNQFQAVPFHVELQTVS